jgi:REP element-mobilizing transposase RayT
MRSRYPKSHGATTVYFVTAVTWGRRPIFLDDDCVRHFRDVLAEVSQSMRVIVYAFAVMPDHVHLVVNCRDVSIGRFMWALKGLCARRVIDALVARDAIEPVRDAANRPHQRNWRHKLWQRSSHCVPLFGERSLRDKIAYVRKNIARRPV